MKKISLKLTCICRIDMLAIVFLSGPHADVDSLLAEGDELTLLPLLPLLEGG